MVHTQTRTLGRWQPSISQNGVLASLSHRAGVAAATTRPMRPQSLLERRWRIIFRARFLSIVIRVRDIEGIPGPKSRVASARSVTGGIRLKSGQNVSFVPRKTLRSCLCVLRDVWFGNGREMGWWGFGRPLRIKRLSAAACLIGAGGSAGGRPGSSRLFVRSG